MMLDLEPGAYLCHHVIVQVETIVRYDSFESPYRHMISFLMKRATTDFVTLAYDVAFTHLVKQLMTTKMKRWPFEAFGVIGPITSMPHIEKGHGDTITFKDVGETCILSAQI